MFAFLAPYKILIIIIAVAALFGTVGTVAYNKGYSRASDAAAARELKIETASNKALQIANDIAVKTNEKFAEIQQNAEVKNHENQIIIDTTRTQLAAVKRLRDPYRKPADCGVLPKAATAASGTVDAAAPGELSEELSGFLKQQAYEADQVAVYAQTCHEWAMNLVRP